MHFTTLRPHYLKLVVIRKLLRGRELTIARASSDTASTIAIPISTILATASVALLLAIPDTLSTPVPP